MPASPANPAIDGEVLGLANPGLLGLADPALLFIADAGLLGLADCDPGAFGAANVL
jgi:hypothetical protein